MSARRSLHRHFQFFEEQALTANSGERLIEI